MGLNMAELDPERKDEHEGQESEDIKVTDRRLFTREGVLREGVSESEEKEELNEEAPAGEIGGSGAARQAAPTAGEARPRSGAGFEHRPIEEPEGVEFTMLINAMAQPALIFLGEIDHPGKGKPEVNLEQARLQIDLLDLLRIRCRGNMTPDEEGLLDQILYQLRMLYVARSNPPDS
jgi:hypothetical protein